VTEPFLPYGRQEISEDDIDAVTAVLREPLITQGPRIEAFERTMGEYLGARHVVAVSSGTAALHAAAFAAGLGPGDEALVTPLTFAATANCVLYQGATPRFVDIDAATWNLDIERALAEAGARTRAILPVSFAGLPVVLEPLLTNGDRPLVIEDACHALGARRNGKLVGGPGGADITVFSLHPVKAMTTGEGGLAVTENDDLAARLRMFRTHGIVRDGMHPAPTDGDWYYEMQALGFNYRITDFQCALGSSQLKRLDRWIARRNEIATRYRELLADEPAVEVPPAAAADNLHAYHLFVVQIRAGREARHRVFQGLRAASIGVQVHYIPVYRFPYYRDNLGTPQDGCPETERYYDRCISLPMFPGMRDQDVVRVCKELVRLCAE
jgi:UDP-4-amino-4,6-dideoxy-N-acetyl-beta-L-altrosamine transaminase